MKVTKSEVPSDPQAGSLWKEEDGGIYLLLRENGDTTWSVVQLYPEFQINWSTDHPRHWGYPFTGRLTLEP